MFDKSDYCETCGQRVGMDFVLNKKPLTINLDYDI